MANFTEQAKISPKKFVTSSSRYADSKVLYYTENRYLTFNTYKKNIISLSKGDRYTVVTPGNEYRPDLISKLAYGTVDFWWRIMEANDIKDIYDLKSGRNLRIPPAGLR